MDTLGVPYEYEREGFVVTLEDGTARAYLPDFYLPSLKAWVEVKPGTPSHEEYEVAMSMKGQVFMFCGAVPDPAVVGEGGPPDDVFDILIQGDSMYAWTECPMCGAIGIEFTAFADRIGCRCRFKGRTPNGASPRLLAAYRAARGARFEHGECG